MVKVNIAVVVNPNVKSSNRRVVYNILNQSGIKTDIGWIVFGKDVLKRFENINKKSIREEKVKTVVVYQVDIPPETYLHFLVSSADKITDQRLHSYVQSEINKIKSLIERKKKKIEMKS